MTHDPDAYKKHVTRSCTLEMAIESFLRAGKKREHEDFQALIAYYGDAKISELARKILKEMKAK